MSEIAATSIAPGVGILRQNIKLRPGHSAVKIIAEGAVVSADCIPHFKFIERRTVVAVLIAEQYRLHVIYHLHGKAVFCCRFS